MRTRIATAVLLLPALFTPTFSLGADTPPALDYESLVEAVNEIELKLQRIRGSVDQATFEPGAWLDVLDYDAAEVVQAVGDTIAFQPYAGTLRGVVGTLRARAGNSLDQSLLLAWLLKSAGYDARIVRGTLDQAQSRRLLQRLGAPERRNSLDGLRQAIEAQFGSDAFRDGQQPLAWDETTVGTRTAAAEEMLLEALSDAAIDLEPHDVTDELAETTRTYFWVQYRDGAAAGWRDAHPAFGETPPDGLEAEEYFADSIPEQYQHRVTIRAWLSQRRGTSVTNHALMSPFSRPAANLHGVAIGLRNHPGGLRPETLATAAEAIASSRLFLPMLNESLAPGAMAFDLAGRVVDPMALSSGGAGLFATLAERMDSGSAAVANRDDGQPLVALESVWLEFTFSTPGGDAATYRRYVLPPPSERDPAGAPVWSLITDHAYMIDTGAQPLQFLADRYLAAGITGAEWYKALIHEYLYPDAGTAMPESEQPRDFPLLAQYLLMAAEPAATDGVIAYRAQPTLVGMRHGFRDPQRAFAGVDVVRNGMRHLTLSPDGRLLERPAAALRRGVWETGVETLPGLLMHAEVKGSASVLDVFEQAAQQGIGFDVLLPAAAEASGDTAVTISRAMRADLERGYVLVVPRRTPQGVLMGGWWRIDPDTGETLGMTADGYGQSAVEYLTDLTGTALGLVQALQSIKDCKKKTDTVQQICCLVEGYVNNVAGFGFGSVLGATVGSAGAAVFTIVDYGTQAATQKAFGQAQGLLPQAQANCSELPRGML